MATIPLVWDCHSTTTTISNTFIDFYMAEANGEYVKVYLYLMRLIGDSSKECSISAIADRLDHTEKDILRALKYWERAGLLVLSYESDKSVSGIRILDIPAPVCDSKPATDRVTTSKAAASSVPTAASSASTEAASGKASSATLPAEPVLNILDEPAPKAVRSTHKATTAKRKEYSADEIEAFSATPDVTELLFVFESYLKKALSATDMNTILYWYDGLSFSADLIEYLAEYCISKGHTSLRYMDKVALSWHEAGITTVEQAKENAATHSKAYYTVMKALGINGRNLVEQEIAYVDRWYKEYAFDLDLIKEACRRTIAATHQPSFEYTDTILTNWHKNQVHNMTDVAKLDAAHTKAPKPTGNTTVRRTGFSNFNQRNNDYDALEAMLLNTSVQ